MYFPILVIALVVLIGLVGMHRRRSLRAVPSSPRATWLGPARGVGVAMLAVTTGASLFLVMGTASAYDVATVDLDTAADFSVLGGSTVTNTGSSVLARRVGVWSGTAITGFGPGTAAGVEAGTLVAMDAQASLTSAYVDAENRDVNLIVAADLTGLTLVGGVYAGAAGAALSLPGTLTLNGEGDPNSVFIFQTASTLTTGPGSTVLLTNGAQACNVFWQVGSSATLGTGSTFAGNILALTSITVENSVTVDGRALARNGAVTLDTNVFTTVGCDLSVPTTTSLAEATTSSTTTTTTATTTTEATTTSTTAPTTTTAGVGTTTTTLAASPSTTIALAVAGTTTTLVGPLEAQVTTTTEAGDTTSVTTPESTSTSLPFTGQNSIGILVAAVLALVLGLGVLGMSRRDATERD